MYHRPLSNTLLLVSLIGLIIFGILTWGGTVHPAWGFTFTLMFLVFTLASYLAIMPTGDDI